MGRVQLENVALPPSHQSHLAARRLGILRPIGARLHPTHIRGRPRCVVERIEGMDALDESAIALGIKPGPIGSGFISDGPKFIIYFIGLNEGGRKNNAKHQRKPWFMSSAIVLDPNSCRCRLMLRSTPKKENTAVPVDVPTSTCHHFHIFTIQIGKTWGVGGGAHPLPRHALYGYGISLMLATCTKFRSRDSSGTTSGTRILKRCRNMHSSGDQGTMTTCSGHPPKPPKQFEAKG